MKCPFCGSPESKVVDSRPTDEDGSIRRRRQCQVCLKRFTTYETVERIPIVVIKKDESREAFDRGKLIGSMLKCCQKRNTSLGTLEGIAEEIENSLRNDMIKEVESSKIADMVMQHLRTVDEVAYVRFVSVYRQFKDMNSFRKELNRLIRDNK